jgi:inward rectifier potassium channel
MKENFDPGTGASFSHRTKRIINKDGSFNVNRLGTKTGLKDIYLIFIQMDWGPFLLLLTAGFFGMNILFAFSYFALGDGHLGVIGKVNNIDFFLRCFFFSTQTFTTVGYGAISPTSNTASLIASMEAFVGFLSFSIATGLLFGRFSRPNAKIQYSKNALITEVNGERALIFRLANMRSTPLLDLRSTVIIVISKKTDDQGIQREYKRIKLQVSNLDFLPLNWTIVHFINEESPLYTLNEKEIKNIDGEILIHLKAFDEVFSQEVHSRFSYQFNDIVLDAKFVKAYSVKEDGEVTLDLSKINEFKKN